MHPLRTRRTGCLLAEARALGSGSMVPKDHFSAGLRGNTWRRLCRISEPQACSAMWFPIRISRDQECKKICLPYRSDLLHFEWAAIGRRQCRTVFQTLHHNMPQPYARAPGTRAPHKSVFWRPRFGSFGSVHLGGLIEPSPEPRARKTLTSNPKPYILTPVRARAH